jgi:uridine kinase
MDKSAPNLVRSPERMQLLERVARAILALDLPHSAMCVAIDGVDGAGKTVFADELAAMLQARGKAIPETRASVVIDNTRLKRPRAL